MNAKAARPLQKGQKAVLLPGPTRAEPWELWTLGPAEAECLRTFRQPADNHWRERTTLALPAAQVYCLPLWLNQTDTKQLAGMIPLQLELRGLLPRAPGIAIFDWSVVAQESGRSLVTVGILPVSLPPDLQAEAYSEFDLGARYFPLPENALVLWPEQDRLVVAVTRGAELVYFQALAENRFSPSLLQDLGCIRATLAMQGVAVALREIVVWSDASPEEIEALGQALRLPVRQADRPRPRPPVSWKLVPTLVTAARQSRHVRRWQIRAVLLALAVYLLVVLAMLTRLFLTNAHVADLQRWQSEHAQAIALVRDTRAAWKNLRPVVDEKSYPLELLLHAAAAIPADQLHLTLFEAQDGHLLIKGEATNVSAAFQFLDRLKKDPYFGGYAWDMAQPHLLPNDLAQLQIDGTRGPGDF
jgi:hypothetical protein